MIQPPRYDFDIFKECNKKYNIYGNANLRIESVDNRLGICKVSYSIEDIKGRSEEIAIETLVRRYINSTSQLPYITNPSAIKTWKGFQTFRLDDISKKDINYMIIGLREQYTDIVKGLGAIKNGLSFDLRLNNNVVEFSGMMSNEIPFKKKVFKIEGKNIDCLKDEIKSYLFDTLDGIVNIC